MAVNIPISGDPSGLLRSLQLISSTLRQMGADARAFENIDLSHPEIGDLTDDLRRVLANFEQLSKIGRGSTASGVRGVLRNANVTTADPEQRLVKWLEEASRSYADPAERARHIGRVGQYIFNGTRFASSGAGGPGGGSAPGGGGGSGGSGGGRGGGRPGGTDESGFASNIAEKAGGKALGMFKGFGLAMLAAAGIKGIAGLTNQAIGLGVKEDQSNDVLLRTVQGAASDFDALRKSVRDTTKGLYLTYQQGQELTEQFAKLTNEADPAKLQEGVRTSAGFARAYGLDPNQTTGTFGAAAYLGESPRQFAELIAAAVSQGNMTGQADQVSQAILGFIQSTSRVMLSGSGAASMASLYTAMNATGSPMLRGQNGLALLGTINQTMSQGGGGGMAGRTILLQALASNGISDPYEADELIQGGAWATPSSMNMKGARNPNMTNYAALLQQIRQYYRGVKDPYVIDVAMSQAFGITPAQAHAMNQIQPADLDYMQRWSAAHGVNLSGADPTAIQDINAVLQPGADLESWRKRLLAANSGYNLSTYDRNGLASAQGADALQRALVQALSDSGMSQTDATRQQQAQADLTNALTTLGSQLVPAVTDLTQEIADLITAIDSNFQPPPPDTGKPIIPLAPGSMNPNVSMSRLPPSIRTLIHMTVPDEARHAGLDPVWMGSLVAQEGWNGADSPKGAIGPMQLLPGTAKQLGVDPRSITQNISGGTEYFKELLAQYGGDYDVAAAAYNAGPNGHGVSYFYQTGDMSHLPLQTQNYVRGIETAYAHSGGNLQTLHLRAEPVTVIVKNPAGQILGKGLAQLRGKAVPSGQRPQ